MRPVLPRWALLLGAAILVMGGLIWVRVYPPKPPNPLEDSVEAISDVFGMTVSVGPHPGGGELVEKVRPGSLAERIGFRVGERIVAVGERSVWHVRQLQELISQRSQMGQPLTVMVTPDDKVFRVLTFGPVPLPPPASPDEHGHG